MRNGIVSTVSVYNEVETGMGVEGETESKGRTVGPERDEDLVRHKQHRRSGNGNDKGDRWYSEGRYHPSPEEIDRKDLTGRGEGVSTSVAG